MMRQCIKQRSHPLGLQEGQEGCGSFQLAVTSPLNTPHRLRRTGTHALTFPVTGEHLSTAKTNKETQLRSTACGNYFSGSLPFGSDM